MTISGALSNALSGLSAVSRMAEVVSSNVSNSMTEGYAPREAQLAQRMLGSAGAGVMVTGVHRNVDPVILANRRLSEAELGQVSVRVAFLTALENAIGMPDDPNSLSGRMSNLDAALISAASRPDSDARLLAAVDAARAVTTHLNDISDQIQGQRMQADQGINAAVGVINTSLEQIADLNTQILGVETQNMDSSALMDQRQRLIDQVAGFIPLREITRDNGTVALFSTGGATLLDGLPAELGFAPVGLIVPEMNIGAGGLSGLTINGQPVSTSNDSGPIAGGRLSGLFELRDVQAVEAQSQLDAVARDLVERFQDPAVDPTLNPGDAGLFTDAGAAFDTADELGLSSRVSLNALVDPQQGGETWRLRDGLGAATPGDAGDATLLNALDDTLNAQRLPASGGFVMPQSAAGISSGFLSTVSISLQSSESQQTYSRAQHEALTALELEQGVDTDAEMQKLLQVEQAFAANARVIQTVDEMIQTLLGI